MRSFLRGEWTELATAAEWRSNTIVAIVYRNEQYDVVREVKKGRRRGEE